MEFSQASNILITAGKCGCEGDIEIRLLTIGGMMELAVFHNISMLGVHL